MAQPIRLTLRGQKYLINPDQIVFVEASGSGASNVYFTNREYRQFEESVETVEALWHGLEVVQTLADVPPASEPPADETPANEPPADETPAEHPAKGRQTNPATPPETK